MQRDHVDKCEGQISFQDDQWVSGWHCGRRVLQLIIDSIREMNRHGDERRFEHGTQMHGAKEGHEHEIAYERSNAIFHAMVDLYPMVCFTEGATERRSWLEDTRLATGWPLNGYGVFTQKPTSWKGFPERQPVFE